MIVATKNPGKIREIKKYFNHLPLEVYSLKEVEGVPEIVEDGNTFSENARKKADVVSTYYPDDIIMADDSGLEVDALDGEPGVFSARYAGENASDAINNAKLLEKLKGVSSFQKTARFCCAIAIKAPGKETVVVQGNCSGLIAEELRGEGGFGYDPLFIVPAYDKTFAEISLEIKNEISHRSKALARASRVLEKLF